MEMTYVIILGAIYLGLVGLAFLVWAIKTGQFEDMEGPKYRILLMMTRSDKKGVAYRVEGSAIPDPIISMMELK